MSYSDEILDFQEETYQDPELYLAGSGLRFANYILDRIGMYIVLFSFFMVVELLGGNSLESDETSGFELLLMLLVIGGYWIIPEYLWGKTPAKLLTRTKVITIHGERPTFMNIVGRTLCRLIPFEPFSFLGSRPVGWHDSISKTRVVKNEYNIREDYLR